MPFLFQSRSARLRQKQKRNTNIAPYPRDRNTNVASEPEDCSAYCLKIFPEEQDKEKREECVFRCANFGLSEPEEARSQLMQYYESETGQSINSNKAVNKIIESEINRRAFALQELEEQAKKFSKDKQEYLATYTAQVINFTIAKLTEMFNVFGASGQQVAESMWGGEMLLSTGKQVVNFFKIFHNWVLRDPKMAHLTSIAAFVIRQEFCAWASAKLDYPTKAVYVDPRVKYLGEFRDLLFVEFLDDFIDKGMSPMMDALKDMMLAVFTAIGGAALALVKSGTALVGATVASGVTAGAGALGVGALAVSGPIGWGFMGAAGIMYAGTEYLKSIGESMVQSLMLISRVVLKIMVRSFSDVAKNIVKVSHVLKTYNNIARIFTEPCRYSHDVWDPTGALKDDTGELVQNAQENASQLYNSIADYSSKLLGGVDANEKQINKAIDIMEEISGPQKKYMEYMLQNATPVDGTQAPHTYEKQHWLWRTTTETLIPK